MLNLVHARGRQFSETARCKANVAQNQRKQENNCGTHALLLYNNFCTVKEYDNSRGIPKIIRKGRGRVGGRVGGKGVARGAQLMASLAVVPSHLELCKT